MPPRKKIRANLIEQNNRALTRAIEDLQLETSRLLRQITELERLIDEVDYKASAQLLQGPVEEDTRISVTTQTKEDEEEENEVDNHALEECIERLRPQRKNQQRVSYAEPSLKKKMRRH